MIIQKESDEKSILDLLLHVKTYQKEIEGFINNYRIPYEDMRQTLPHISRFKAELVAFEKSVPRFGELMSKELYMACMRMDEMQRRLYYHAAMYLEWQNNYTNTEVKKWFE